MRQKKKDGPKLGVSFYIGLGALTVGVLASLALWLWLDETIYLIVMLVMFVLYLFHLIFGLARSGRAFQRAEEDRSAFLLHVREDVVVYLTYLGGERHVRRPPARKKDYLVEFYAPQVDLELLKRHLWFDLPPERERELSKSFIAEARIPRPLLNDIRGKTVLIQEGFCEVAETLPEYADFFAQNTVVRYGA